MYGSDNPSPVYQYSGGKYRICNADGSNKRVLCDISDTTDVIDFGASAFGDVSGVGDYVVLKATGYDVIEESDEKGRRILESTGDKYISVNIKTGEYKTVTMG